MGTRVLKFGGTSVETPTHILSVARRILAAREKGDPIVVVVSAMGQTTDELVRLAHRVSRTPPQRELDMLLTAGERISMTLLAMCLESMGCPAISFTGSQGGIITDSRHADARIQSVRGTRLEEELARGRVVIVAGFQGVSREKEVTTLGRGGSDTTAVALAIRLGAERCEIFTDVPGVLSADPRVVPGAHPIPEIGYDPMIVLSVLGGRVLFRRAVILARKYGLSVEVASSLTGEPGTRVRGSRRPLGHKEEEPMESSRILAVALESPVHWVRITCPAGRGPAGQGSAGQGPADAPGLPSGTSPLFLAFQRTTLPDGRLFIQFVASPEGALEPWFQAAQWGSEAAVEVERHAALVSLVGEDVLSDAATLRRAEASLQTKGIPIWASHTGTLSLSLLVPEKEGERAARALHEDLVGRP